MASLFIYSCADDATTIASSNATERGSQIENRDLTNWPDCFQPFEATLNCIDQGSDTYSVEFELDEGCKARATWQVFYCLSIINGVSEYRVYMSEFVAEPVEGSCDMLINLWNGYAASNQDELLLKSMRDFETEVSLLAEEYSLIETLPWFNFPECGQDGSINVFTEFYRSICNQLYKVQEVKGRVVTYSFEIVSCADVCCKRESQYCFVDGGTEVLGEPNLTVIGVCASEPSGPYGIGYTAVGGCNTECSE